MSPVCAVLESIVLSNASTILVFSGMYACCLETTAVADVVVLFVEVAVVSVAAKRGEIDIDDNIIVQSKIGNNLMRNFLIINNILSKLIFLQYYF